MFTLDLRNKRKIFVSDILKLYLKAYLIITMLNSKYIYLLECCTQRLSVWRSQEPENNLKILLKDEKNAGINTGHAL